MKLNVNQINKRVDNAVANMPLGNVRKLYYDEVYDSYHSLWLDLDIPGFEKKFEECISILKKVNPDISRELLLEDSMALNEICYDLRNEMDNWKEKYRQAAYTSWISITHNLLTNLEVRKTYRSLLDFKDIEMVKKSMDQCIYKFESEIFTKKALKEIEKQLDEIENNEEFYNENKDIVDVLRRLYINYIEHRFETNQR